MRLSVWVLGAQVRSSAFKRTVPAPALCASSSWPSFSRSNSPSVLDLAIVTWSCYTASIFASQVGPFSASHRDRQGRRSRRRPSNLKRSSLEEGFSESACFLGRCPLCLEPACRQEGLEWLGCEMIVLLLIWVVGRTGELRGWWKMRRRGYWRGSW